MCVLYVGLDFVMGGEIEARFARKLASNDARTRSKAVRSLRKWMADRSVASDGMLGVRCGSIIGHPPYCHARRAGNWRESRMTKNLCFCEPCLSG